MRKCPFCDKALAALANISHSAISLGTHSWNQTMQAKIGQDCDRRRTLATPRAEVPEMRMHSTTADKRLFQPNREQ